MARKVGEITAAPGRQAARRHPDPATPEVPYEGYAAGMVCAGPQHRRPAQLPQICRWVVALCRTAGEVITSAIVC